MRGSALSPALTGSRPRLTLSSASVAGPAAVVTSALAFSSLAICVWRVAREAIAAGLQVSQGKKPLMKAMMLVAGAGHEEQ